MKDQRENNAQNTAGNAEESQETIADGQYPIMGNSRVTVDEMVDYFRRQENLIRKKLFPKVEQSL